MIGFWVFSVVVFELSHNGCTDLVMWYGKVMFTIPGGLDGIPLFTYDRIEIVTT